MDRSKDIDTILAQSLAEGFGRDRDKGGLDGDEQCFERAVCEMDKLMKPPCLFVDRGSFCDQVYFFAATLRNDVDLSMFWGWLLVRANEYAVADEPDVAVLIRNTVRLVGERLKSERQPKVPGAVPGEA